MPPPRSVLARPAAAVALVVALLAGAVACSTNEASDRSPTEQEDRTDVTDGTATDGTTLPAAGEIDFDDCGDMECGTLEVPLDYDDPEGDTIELSVVRDPARDEDDRIGVLFVNPGGPGASGVEFVRSGALEQYTAWFDVIGWDPRGVGDSTPLECETETEGEEAIDELRAADPQPDDDAEQAELDEAARELADLCGELDTELLEHIDSEVNAFDIDQLRQALGEEQISFLGYSYGTLLGQEYARQFPSHVRAMVLDGVVDPEKSLTDFLEQQAVGLDGVLDPVADKYDRVAAIVEREPLPARRGEVGPSELALAAFASSYSAGGLRALERALDAAEQGDGTALAVLAQTYLDAGGYASYVAVLCADSDHPEGSDEWQAFVERVSARAPRLGAAVANEVVPCAFWPVEPTRSPSPMTTEGLPPVLVVGTTGDVATPYEDAVKVAEDIPGAVLLTYEGEGHTSSGRCAAEAIEAYLVDLELPDEGTVCRS